MRPPDSMVYVVGLPTLANRFLWESSPMSVKEVFFLALMLMGEPVSGPEVATVECARASTIL